MFLLLVRKPLESSLEEKLVTGEEPELVWVAGLTHNNGFWVIS